MGDISLKHLYLQQLVNGLPAILSEIAPNGACKPEYWGITNQDVIYSLALAYGTRHAANPYCGDHQVLEAASLVGDYLRSLQDESGKVEFVKIPGSRWGRIYMPWTMYHWLESFHLLKDSLAEKRKREWQQGLQTVMQGLDGEIRAVHGEEVSDQERFEKNWLFRKPFEVNNISTWNGMSLVRAGQIFGRSDWAETGKTMIREAARAMDPGGYWPEFGGPTTFYNLISLHALGLYYAFTGDEFVLPFLEKGTEFQTHFTYPDGRVVETIDGRVRYDDRVQERGHPAFLPFPQGRGYLRFLQRCMEQDAASPRPPEAIYTVFDLPFFQCRTSAPSSANPFLLVTLQHLKEQDEIGETGPPQSHGSFLYTLRDRALVRKQGDWFYCLSGFTLQKRESKWAMDRQNHASLWHRRAGLIVGGGNSQDQPEWSNFVVAERPTALDGRVEVEPEGDAVLLSFPGTQCWVKISILSESQATMTLGVREESARRQTRSNIVLKLRPESPIETAHGERFFFTDQPIFLHSRRIGPWFRHGGWRLSIPADATLAWPSLPAHNPYTPDGSSPFASARGILSVSHVSQSPVRLGFLIE